MQHFETSDGVAVAYREVGEGRDVALFVHGWMATGAVWDALLPTLLGVRRIVPELRGTVGSPAPAGTITLERLARDVLELLARVDGDVHLVGHSMGGQIAMSVAAEAGARIRSLALLSTVPPDGLALPGDVAERFRAAGGDPHALGGILDVACKVLSPEARRALVDEAAAIDPAAIAASFDAWSRGGVDGRALARIECPTMVVASDDPFLPASLLESKVVRSIPRARLVRLEGPGHYPQVEAPHATAELLGDFWGANP